MKPKESRRVQMTKRLIQEALILLMEGKNINKISIKEICENANVNRSTFYVYYANQYELLNEIEQNVINEIPLIPEDNNLETIKKLEIFFSYIEQNQRIFRNLLSYDYSFRKKLIEAIEYMYIKPNNNALDPSERIYQQMQIDYITAGCLYVIEKWVNNNYPITAPILIEWITQIRPN